MESKKMGDKSTSLEDPSASAKGINGYQKSILAIFIIFTLVFIGYYFLLLPYQDDSDLDDFFSYSDPSDHPLYTRPSQTNADNIDYYTEIDENYLTPLDNYFDSDYIETTESSIVSEEFMTVDISNEFFYPDGSGNDDDLIESEENIPNCSRSFKISNDKLICLVEAEMTPKDAATYCKTNSMKFLRILDNKIKQKAFEVSKKVFGVGGGSALWIDGKWNELTGNWYTTNHEQLLIHPNDRILGDCMRIFSPLGQKFEISSARCSLQSYFYCEKRIRY